MELRLERWEKNGRVEVGEMGRTEVWKMEGEKVVELIWKVEIRHWDER